MLKKITLLILSAAVLTAGLDAAASGYSSGGYNDRQANSERRAVDQNYETGKAIFKGRQLGEPSLEYCIAVDGEKVPVKRKSLRTYKGATFDSFAKSLFQCDEPEKMIAEGLTRDSLLYVVYYLNKRHKLALRGS